MGVITSYPDDTATTDNDKFLTSDASGSTKLTSASVLKSYVLSSGSVTNAMLSATAGEPGGAWASWTPSWTNLTVGNGTVEAKYTKIGKTVFARINIDFGTTTSVSGDIVFSLPVTAAANAGTGNITPRGVATAFSGTAIYPGTVGNTSTTTANLRFHQVAGSYVTLVTTTSSTVPFTWSSSAEIGIQFSYEVA